MSQSMSTELPLETPIGNLLSSLDEETRARVLEKPCMSYPLVAARSLLEKMIQEKLTKWGYFDTVRGRFFRLRTTLGAKPGIMGCINGAGYIQLRISGCTYLQSHLVALWFLGKLPTTREEIDHIDGNRSNDCPKNLRIVSRTLNSRNCKMNKRNTSGFTGVIWHSVAGKWQSRIKINQQQIYFGLFNTAEEAYAARQTYIKDHPELGFTTRHGI